MKVIVSTDPAVRDSIIRATNNQTSVELASLHATDKIQRDIEDVLLQHGIFYERRTNYYKNQGRATSELVTPMYLASGYVTLVLKSPSTATSLRTKFMRSDESYERVFSADAPLLVWPSIAKIMRRTDEVLEGFRPHGRPANSQFLKTWRQITAFVVTARVFGTFAFNESQLSTINLDAFTDDLFDTSWDAISFHAGDKLKARYTSKKTHVIEICQHVAAKYFVNAVQAVERTAVFPPTPKKRRAVTEEFAAKVNLYLPEQPWPPGVHRDVAKSLRCSPVEVYDAIQKLIDEGKRHIQKDGVVYAQDGAIIAIDESRASDK